MFKSLNGLTPSYLFELLSMHAPVRTIRSSSQLILTISRTKLKTQRDRAFAVARPRLWNSLPLKVRSAQTFELFESLLKTHFYELAFSTG